MFGAERMMDCDVLMNVVVSFLGVQFILKHLKENEKKRSFCKNFLLDTTTWAVSSQGMQDHFGAKSANWLAG